MSRSVPSDVRSTGPGAGEVEASDVERGDAGRRGGAADTRCPRSHSTDGATGGQATILSASGGLVGALSYAANLIMAHLLAPASYTSFAAAAGLVATAGIASTALIPLPLAHVVRARPVGSPQRRDATTFAVGVSVLVGIVAGALVAALTAGFAPTSTALAAGVSALALFVIAPVWGRLQGEARFVRYAVLTVGEVAVRLVVGVVAVLLGAGAWGAIGAFAVGALVVLVSAGRIRDVGAAALRRVLVDGTRWAETGGVAAVQAVLSVLAVADLVTVAATVADATAAGGYQALATLAKAPVYVAVGTALVSFPALRASVRDRDRLLREALGSFVRLVVPAAVGVATVPAVLVGLVLPDGYLPAVRLLGWLALAGVGVGATTVLAMLLLAVGARAALVGGLAVAVAALGAGLVAGVVDGTVAGFARAVALGSVAGAGGLAVAGRRYRPAGSGAAAARGVAYALAVLALLGVTRGHVVAWLVAALAVGVAVVALPVVAGRLRAAADHGAAVAPGGLHVLHLAFEDPAMPGSGGGALRTGEIDRRLAAAGHRVTVMTTRYPGARDRTEHHGGGSVRWVHLGVGRGGNRLTRLLGYVAGVPWAVRSIDADLVVEDFFAPISSMGVPWFSPAPTVGVVQWLNAREKARQYKLPVHWIERITVRSHTHVVTVSRGVAEKITALSPRTATTVIGNGVDPTCFAARRDTAGTDVVFVGRLEIAQKGLDLLLDAWALLLGREPHLEGQLVVAGTGPDEAALRERVERLEIAGRVRFAGWVAGAAKAELVAAARLAAVPSRFETFGIVGAEALATGTAVVAYDIDCLREVVPRDVGVLVPLTGDHDTDVVAYADALGAAYIDDDLLSRAAVHGPAVAARYDWDALAEEQEHLYRRLTGEGS